MATFSSFQDILPDPNNYLSEAGSSQQGDAGASLGPGFTSVKFSSKQPTMGTRTNSGRYIARSIAAHSWNIDINYNSLTRAEFEPVFSFLMSRQGKLNPFFLELPQYLTSQDSTFASSVVTNDVAIAEALLLFLLVVLIFGLHTLEAVLLDREIFLQLRMRLIQITQSVSNYSC